jgi:hypothetical protein
MGDPPSVAAASGFVHMNHTAASTHTTVTRTTISFLLAAAHEQWERELREAELEAERIRLVSATPTVAEPEPGFQFDQREDELVRG